MIATAFRMIEISRNLSIVYSIIFLWFLVFTFFYLVWRIIFGRSSSAKQSKDQRKLIREWCENGTAISNWLKDHYQELDLNPEATISNREFQYMLRKDFEIYNKLVILDPKLKEDPVFNQGRDFYQSLIRTKNST